MFVTHVVRDRMVRVSSQTVGEFEDVVVHLLLLLPVMFLSLAVLLLQLILAQVVDDPSAERISHHVHRGSYTIPGMVNKYITLLFGFKLPDSSSR